MTVGSHILPAAMLNYADEAGEGGKAGDDRERSD